MTIPYMMNCSHDGDGWCLACVRQLGEEIEQLRKALAVFANRRNWIDAMNPVWDPCEPPDLPSAEIWEFAQEALDAK